MALKNLCSVFIVLLFSFSLFLTKVIAEPTFVQSKSINADDGEFGLTFNNDGTKMYTTLYDNTGAGQQQDAVYEYVLTTAYDISTATLNNTLVIHDTTIDGNGNAMIPTQVVFNNDGTKMFIANHSNNNDDYINYFDLSTPFDISTATIDNRLSLDSTGADEKRLNSVAFNNDGTRLFAAGVNNILEDRIHEFTLDTPYDLSSGVTHVNTEDMSSYHDYIDGVTFKDDGTKMYTIDSETEQISQFKLTTPYDVSTLSLEGTFDVSSYDIAPREVAFSNDGSKMFFIGDTNDKVYEFNLSCNWSIIDGACDDPADDKEISSSIESQTETAKQIAIQASTPVLNRMYWLRRHRTSDQLSNQNINFNFPNKTIASLAKVFPIAEKTNNTLNKLSDNWSFWSEGSVSFGRTGDTSSSASKDINSTGITIGMDKKISENRLYGYALRFGNDEVDIGSSGTSLDTESFSLSLYGTFPHNEERFTESIIGISTLKTDHVRVGGGNRRTGERDGAQVFGSINYVTKYKKNNFVIDPNIRIDLSYTELSKYREKGVAALVYNKQTVETGMVSTGFTISDILDFDTFTFKSYGGLELGLDFSPSSDATYRYLSETTEYTKAIDQDSKNLRANIGFDLINENGLSIMTIYERNQSDNSHSDTLYFGLGYVPSDDIEYAMNLDNNKAYLSYNRNLNGFDIRVNSNYNLMSSIPDYGATIELVSTF